MTNAQTLDQMHDSDLDDLVASLQPAGNKYGARLEIGVFEITMHGYMGSTHTLDMNSTNAERLRCHWNGFIQQQPAYQVARQPKPQPQPVRVRDLTANQMYRIGEELGCLEEATDGLRGGTYTLGATYVEATPAILEDLHDRLDLCLDSVECDPELYLAGGSVCYGLTDAQADFALKQIKKTYTSAMRRIRKALDRANRQG